MVNIQLIPIEAKHNAALAVIIRTSLKEFNAAKPGTVYFDKSTDELFELFQQEKAYYAVAVADGIIAGGAGIYPTAGLPGDTCELVKMYLQSTQRGKGIGKMLMEHCIEIAKNKGFKKLYLETMPELVNAVPMYEKFGFAYLQQPLGNTGHSGCNIWMIKSLY